MARRIDTQAVIDWIRHREQAGDPGNPDVGYWYTYFKSDGLYYVEDDGTVVGPLIDASGVTVPPIMTLFTVEGDLTVDSNPLRIYNNYGASRTISEVFLSVDTAPTGAAIIVDVNKDGTTIFTNQANRPQIAAAANTGNTTTIDVASWGDGEYLTVDVDQIGSGTAGSDLTIHIIHL